MNVIIAGSFLLTITLSIMIGSSIKDKENNVIIEALKDYSNDLEQIILLKEEQELKEEERIDFYRAQTEDTRQQLIIAHNEIERLSTANEALHSMRDIR